MRSRGQREDGDPPSPRPPTRGRRKRRQWHGEEGHRSRPQVSPQPQPPPAPPPTHSPHHPAGAFSRELVRMGAAAVSTEVWGAEKGLRQDGDNNSTVTQLGPAPGVPAPSHLSTHTPFQGNLWPKLSGPRLHASERCQLERQMLKSSQKRHLLSQLQTSSGFTGDAGE